MSGASASDVAVTLVRSGTANYGTPDYTDDGISFTVSAGSTLHTVNVTIDDDTDRQKPPSMTSTLSVVVGSLKGPKASIF
jgi:hypothetical protein